MHSNTLSPVGVEVSGLDLRHTPDDSRFVPAFRQLLAEHGVVVVRDQHLDDEAFLQLLRRFGDLVFTEGETPVDGYPDLNVVSNVGRSVPPRSVFHVDTSYLSSPPAYTALRAVTVPEQGGQTLFTNQYAAYSTLPDDLHDLLHGRSIRHVVTGVTPGPGGQQTQAWHPAFRAHPLTGRISVYLSTPQRCVEVSGLSADEGAAAIERLYAHSTSEANTLRHAWAPGDVVMWDNGCVLHKADHTGVLGDRVMHRGMVAGYGTSADAA